MLRRGGKEMRIRHRAAALIAAIGLQAAIASCAGAETLKIGVIAALTGGGAPWGMATAYGPKILAAEINARGGLAVAGKTYQVEIIAYDDQYKAADAVAAYNRLVNQDGAKYVFIMSSAATLALKQNVEDDKVLGLTASYTSNSIDPASHYMFSIYSTPPDYIDSFAGWMKDNVSKRDVVIINPNDETGWSMTQFAERSFRRVGFNVVGKELYERSAKDFQPLLTKVIAMKPDIIELGSTSPVTAGLLVRQARELGYKGLFVKTGGAGPKDVVAGAGKEASEGMINMLYADPANQGYQRIAAAYRKAVGQDPNEIIVAFYDATNVLLHAIQKAGDIDDTAKVAAAFATALPMESVQGDQLSLGGKATFGVDHQILSVNYIGAIRNGEPVVIGKTK
jgi:branched-chain amino acid transport system substrate-binding protein